MAGRTVRRFIAGLGYRVHTPGSVFGRDRLEKQLLDEDWLPVAGTNGWVVFGRDQHILERENELRAYLDAKIHMFLLPGAATIAQILLLLGTNLEHICALACARKPGVYWLTHTGVVNYERRRANLARSRKRAR
ncbi:hypothetical protein [Asanoa hainanensis]|nr:hypothetical protein [Asanoa hainanensis]